MGPSMGNGLSGSMHYDDQSGEIVVWVNGNEWRKKAKKSAGLAEAGIDLNNPAEIETFTKAAGPGGAGLEDLGYRRTRVDLG